MDLTILIWTPPEKEEADRYSGTARRKGRQQTNRTYCHRATSRLYRTLRIE